MSIEVTIPVTFTIGTLEEVCGNSYYLRQNWVSAEADGRTYDLDCGAGLGNSKMQASIHEGDRAMYAGADIQPLAQTLFAALREALDGAS